MLHGKQCQIFVHFQILVSTASLFAACEALAAQARSASLSSDLFHCHVPYWVLEDG